VNLPVAALLRALHTTDPGALRLRRWDSCLPTTSLSDADGRSDMSVVVVDIDIISDASEILSCTIFCCARLAVGDKSFTYGIANELVGTGGGANVGIGTGGRLGFITRGPT
jgi:hypothetical protein